MAIQNCFYIQNISGFDIQMEITEQAVLDCSYDFSFDQSDWSKYSSAITIPNNEKLYIKGTKTSWIGDNPGRHEGAGTNWFRIITPNAKTALGGSIMSLLHDGDGDNEEPVHGRYNYYYLFCEVFKGNTSIVDISNLKLPSKVTPYYFWETFMDCTSLTSLPKNLLPATTVAVSCYVSMFRGCTGLTSIPDNFLPAKTVAADCYASMFYGCTGLTSLPGDLLPAKGLKSYCYRFMFDRCTNLSKITVHFTVWSPDDATSSWLLYVAPSGTFICPEDLPDVRGDSRIPYGWKVVRLPSGPIPTKLVQMCDYGLGGLF